MNNLREELAALEHEQWAHWTRYMLENSTLENIERWKKQCETDYKDLSETEKNSDRSWADKVVDILNNGSNKIEITEAQTNLLKKLEDAAYSHYQDPGGKYCIDTITRLGTIRECCIAIGIEREIVSENEDIGKERAFTEMKEKKDND